MQQIGAFMSRSSVNMFAIDKIWEMTALQCINVIILLLQIMFFFIPSPWMIDLIILWVGILSGLTYVNTFYLMNKNVPFIQQKFALGLASFGDSMGIAIATGGAILVHRRLCEMDIFKGVI